MSMNDLLIECQNRVTELEGDRDRLAAALSEANNKLDDVRDSFCGRNLMISGWHLNGDLEPVDNWFDSNDWEPVQGNEQLLIANIRAKTLEDATRYYTHKWKKEFEDVHISIISKGAGFIHPEALLQYAADIRQDAKDGE